MSFRMLLTRVSGIQGHVIILALSLAILFTSIPSGAAAKISCAFDYQVRYGDTLEKIANRFNVKPVDIVRVNKIQRPYIIYVGQGICIPDRSKAGFKDLPNVYARAQAGYFVASWDARGVKIQVLNARSNDNFYVRVSDPGSEKSKTFKIGIMKTTKKGGNTSTYRLPRELRGVNQLTVCLKSARSNVLMCNYLSGLAVQSYPVIQLSRVPK